MKRLLSAVVAVGVIILAGTAMLPNSTFAEAKAVSACSALDPIVPGCCACNGAPPFVQCMEVRHNGVASCTFEFCSSTNCTVQLY